MFLKALNPKLPQDVAAPLQSVSPKKPKAETRYVCTPILAARVTAVKVEIT